MIFDGRWKYIHVEKMRPILYDLQTDPDELVDLGADPGYADHLHRLAAMHFEWSRQHHSRTTMSAEMVEKMTDGKEPPGILIGYANKEEVDQSDRIFPRHVER